MKLLFVMIGICVLTAIGVAQVVGEPDELRLASHRLLAGGSRASADEIVLVASSIGDASINTVGLWESGVPILEFRRSQNTIVLSWEQTGFVLQQTSNVIDTNSWENVNDSGFVEVHFSNASERFFRLRAR